MNKKMEVWRREGSPRRVSRCRGSRGGNLKGEWREWSRGRGSTEKESRGRGSTERGSRGRAFEGGVEGGGVKGGS
jgi:hypothetical protein